jgi:hypothetical protein
MTTAPPRPSKRGRTHGLQCRSTHQFAGRWSTWCLGCQDSDTTFAVVEQLVHDNRSTQSSRPSKWSFTPPISNAQYSRVRLVDDVEVSDLVPAVARALSAASPVARRLRRHPIRCMWELRTCMSCRGTSGALTAGGGLGGADRGHTVDRWVVAGGRRRCRRMWSQWSRSDSGAEEREREGLATLGVESGIMGTGAARIEVE